MGTIGAVGAKPLGLFGGMLGEGAVVGALGGLLGVPSGFLLGTYLVDRVRAIDVGRVRGHHRGALHAEPGRDRSGCGDRMRNPRDDRAGPQAGPRRAAGVDGERRRRPARQDDPDVAAVRRGRDARGRDRRVEDIRARVAAAGHWYLRNFRLAARSGVGHGMGRPACCRGDRRVTDRRASGRRASAACRCPALHAAVRALGRGTRGGNQHGHRLAEHATARHQRCCGAKGRPTAHRVVDLRPIGPRSARRPHFRRHVQPGDRGGRRAQRVVALAVDHLIGTVDARRHRHDTGGLVQPSAVSADRRPRRDVAGSAGRGNRPERGGRRPARSRRGRHRRTGRPSTGRSVTG